MSDFVFDGTSLPNNKVDNAPLTVPANKGLTATEWNTVMSAVSDLRNAYLSDAVDTRAYGLKTTNTGIQNNTAIAAALVAAASVGKGIYIPEGTYKFNLHGLVTQGGFACPAAILIDSSVTLYGDGIDKTILVSDGYVEATYHGPVVGVGYVKDTLNDDACALITTKTTVGGINLIIKDMTLQGPPEGSLTMDQNNVWGIHCDGGGSLTLERVKMTRWVQDIKTVPAFPTYPGTGTIFKATDSHFRYRVIAVLGGGEPGSGDRLDFTNCTFEYHDDMADLLYSTEGGQSNGADHALYIANAASLSTLNCRFLATGGVGGYGWRHFSVSADADPEYSSSTNDYFGPRCKAAIVTHKTFPSTITNATIHVQSGASGITAFGPCHISNCTLVGDAGAIYGITDGSSTSGQPWIKDTVIKGDFLYGIRRVQTASAPWKIGPNVEFRHAASGGGSGLGIVGGGIDMDNCVFQLGAGAAASIFALGGSLVMTNTRHIGSKGMILEANQADLTVEYGDGNHWSDSAPTLLLPDVHTLTLKGQLNGYESSPGVGEGFGISGSGGVITGSLQCGRGLGTYSYSSGTLSVNWKYDTYNLNIGSTPTINTIDMAGSIAVGAVQSDHLKLGSPKIQLYATQAFILGSSGNIKASSQRREAGSLITLQWFPSLTKWVQVGARDDDYMDVQFFGAKGDGTTNDSAAITAAITAASASGLNHVRFSPCSVAYLCDGTALSGTGNAMFTCPNNFKFSGSAAGPIKMKGASQVGFDEGGYLSSDWVIFRIPVGGHDVVFDGVYFYGENGTSSGSGFLKVEQAASACIEFAASTLGDNTRDNTIRNCSFRNLFGFSAHSPGVITNCKFINNTVAWCANGVNLNAYKSVLDGNDLYETEGFECAGEHTSISNNTMNRIWGAAISAGGDTTPGTIHNGLVCSNNAIDLVYDGHGIFLSDSAVGAKTQGNSVSRTYQFGIFSDTTFGGGVNYGNDISNNTIISAGGATPSAYAGAIAYTLGERRTNDGSTWVCRKAGTGGASGPVGSGRQVTGTTVWGFLNAGSGSPNKVGLKASGSAGQHKVNNNTLLDLGLSGYDMNTGIGLGGADLQCIGNIIKTSGTGDGIIIPNGCTVLARDNTKINGGLLYNILAGSTVVPDGFIGRDVTSNALYTKKYDESFFRWSTQFDGTQLWGDGAGAQDTNLYRSAADTLKTDDSMIVGGNSTTNGSAFAQMGSTAPLGTGVSGAGATLKSYWYGVGNNYVGMYGNIDDAATAVGVFSDTLKALSTSGSKIHSFRNNGTEKAFIDKDGVISVAGLTKSNFTDDSGTTGNRTVNKDAGINAFAAASNTITITNSRVTAASRVYAVLTTNDATAIIKNVVPAAGSFTINLTANTTGITKVAWTVEN